MFLIHKKILKIRVDDCFGIFFSCFKMSSINRLENVGDDACICSLYPKTVYKSTRGDNEGISELQINFV